MNTSPDCEQVKNAFASLRERSDVASLLGLTDRALRYRLYARPLRNQYQTFELRKKSGGVRTITAPNATLKSIQRRLRATLECVYEPKAAVHGFNVGCSIKTSPKRLPCSLKYAVLIINFRKVLQRRRLFQTWYVLGSMRT